MRVSTSSGVQTLNPFTKKLAGIAYWSFVAMISGLFLEFTLYVWDFKPQYSLRALGTNHDLLLTLDRKVLFRFMPDARHHINSLGFRDHEFDDHSERPRAVVLGDSFAMGLGVPPEKTFAKVLEANIHGTEIFNLGVQAYGPDQELIAYRDVARNLHPDLVIWAIFPSNDYSDLKKNRLFEITSQGLVPSGVNAVEENQPILRTTMLLRFLWTGHFIAPAKEQALNARLFLDNDLALGVEPEPARMMDMIMREFHDLAASDGAELVTVVIPSKRSALDEPNATQSHLLEDLTLELCRKNALRCINARTVLKHRPDAFSEVDWHLTTTGHALVASQLFAAVAEGLDVPISTD